MIVSDAKEFGLAVRNRRKKMGYTQKDLSDFCGVSVSFLSDLERGKSTAELGKALYIANLLGLDRNMVARGE